ncbi:MAG: cytochrome C551 [Spirochaetaceae bacterium]|nr:cytochrome C551 [Spirochaetaceae bacterium]
MSFEPAIPQKKPYVLEGEEGEKKAWCSCGLSEKQPFCDGSHSRQGTGMSPKIVVCEKSGKFAWCGCKRTKNPPFCDGSHNSL